MKKYLLVVFCAALLFVVTGCGSKNQVKCSGTLSEGGISIKTEVVADFDSSNKLSDATVVYDLDDKDTASQYCSLFKLMENTDKGIKVSCSGSKITIKGYAALADSEDSDEGLTGATKEKFIETMEAESMTCNK